MNRPPWNEYFLGIAKAISTRSTCLRAQYGAVIVSLDNSIISTGYNGAPSGVLSCLDRDICVKEEQNIPSGTRYETCYSVHAEVNAIIRSLHNVRNCNMHINSMWNSNNTPCFMCRRIMANAGILHVIYYDNEGEIVSEDMKLVSMKDIRGEGNEERTR